MPYFGNRTRTPPYRGSGYAGRYDASARQKFSAERHVVVNSNIRTEPAEKCPEPTKEKPSG